MIKSTCHTGQIIPLYYLLLCCDFMIYILMCGDPRMVKIYLMTLLLRLTNPLVMTVNSRSSGLHTWRQGKVRCPQKMKRQGSRLRFLEKKKRKQTIASKVKLRIDSGCCYYHFDFNLPSAMKKKLYIGQINLGKRSNSLQLINRAIDKQYDVLIICEPPMCLLENQVLMDRSIRHQTNPRVVTIALNERIILDPISIDKDLVVTRIRHINITLLNVYFSPSLNFEEKLELVGRIKNIAEDNVDKCIMMGDCNARHTDMGSPFSDRLGKELFKAFYSPMWTPINSPGIPTFKGIPGVKSSSIIDWTVTSQDMVQKAKWEIDLDPDLDTSDHYFISVTVDTGKAIPKPITKLYLPRGEFIREVMRCNLLDNPATAYDKILLAAQSTSRTAKFRPQPKDDNNEIKRLKKYLNKSKKALKRKYSTNSETKQYANNLSKLIKERLSQKRKAQRINMYVGLNKTQAYHQLLKEVTPKQSNTLNALIVDGVPILDEVEITSRLMDHFFNQLSVQPVVYMSSFNFIDDPPITALEIHWAIQKMTRRSAPGNDLINTDTMEKLFERLSYEITKIFNYYLHCGSIPEEAKVVKVIFIKKNQRGPNELTNLRPIGLTSKFLKTFESVITNRLIHFIETTNPMCDRQYGFREGKSSLQAAAAIQRVRRNNEMRNANEVIVSLDIKGAYDNVSCQAIVEALIERGTPDNLVRIVVDYFNDREVRAQTSDGPITRKTTKGLTQGSVLGPLLFSVALDKILDSTIAEFTNESVEVIAYADDISLIISDWNSVTAAEHKISRVMSFITNELKKINLELSVVKTQIMFSSRRNKWPPTTLKIMDTEVKSKSSCKIMGLTFDSDGSFCTHVKELNKKATTIMESLKDHLSRTNRLPRGSRGMLINTKVYSIYNHMCGVWYDPLNYYHKAKVAPLIESISRNASILHLNMYKTAPFTATYAIGERMPLLFHIESQSEIQRQILCGVHSRTKRMIATKLPIAKRIHPAKRVDLTSIMAIHRDDEIPISDYNYVVYTAGAMVKIGESDTCAMALIAISSFDDDRHTVFGRTDDDISMYQLNILALTKACEYLKLNRPKGKQLLLTNQQSIIKALNNYQNQEEAVATLRELILELINNGIMINLATASLHSVTEMTRALTLAKKALEHYTIEYDGIPISIKALKREARNKAWEQLASKYLSRESSTVHDFFGTLEEAKAKHVSITPYTALVYSGHLPTRDYQNRKLRKGDGMCDCGQRQTIRHVLLECIKYEPLLSRAKLTSGLSARIGTVQPSNILRTKEAHKLVSIIAEKLYKKLKTDNVGGTDSSQEEEEEDEDTLF